MRSREYAVAFATHRMSLWLWITLLLVVLIGFMAPHMLSVLTWKAALLTMAAYIGYWVSRAVEASTLRPHELIENAGRSTDAERVWQLEQLAAEAYLRRTLIVAASMIAAALGT